jgi:hypothetical protein
LSLFWSRLHLLFLLLRGRGGLRLALGNLLRGHAGAQRFAVYLQALAQSLRCLARKVGIAQQIAILFDARLQRVVGERLGGRFVCQQRRGLSAVPGSFDSR